MKKKDNEKLNVKPFCLKETHSTMRNITMQKPSFPDEKNACQGVLFLSEGESRKGEGGMRRHGYYKTNLPDRPLITVVTVVFNGMQYIEETIQSVINQTYDNIEYIIIDGGSVDGTVDIIRKYEDAIDYWVSEHDEGIYDAMNKGIRLATGSWVNFMNAGDVFYSSDTITQIFSQDNGDAQIIYGNVHIRYLDFSRIEHAKHIDGLWRGMRFSHQSSFIDLSYHKLMHFNQKNKISADLEFFYGAYHGGVRFKFNDLIFSSVQVGGVSESNRLQTILASRNAVLNQGAWRIVDIFYLLKAIDTLFRTCLKKILPASVVKIIIQLK